MDNLFSNKKELKIQINDEVCITSSNFNIIAGPCSVESEKQIVEIAKKIKEYGANILRGGAFKPRTSPYDFQGRGAEAIRDLLTAKKETNLPVVTEITSINKIDLFEDIDIIQVGCRNMQNYDLLKELGKTKKPILLKRAISATLREWLYSAEYILREGNEKVILCERGIRTFQQDLRNTIDLGGIALLKQETNLPIFVDPSHGTGKASIVSDMTLASVSLGIAGVMLEVHTNPNKSISDAAQTISTEEFKKLKKKIDEIRKVIK